MSERAASAAEQEHLVCPRCSHVGPAHTFKLAAAFVPGWRAASRRRRCPSCQVAEASGTFTRLRGAPGQWHPPTALGRLAARWFE